MKETFISHNSDVKTIKEIARSETDKPVLMLNLNKYVPEADYPNGRLYSDYMEALYSLIAQADAKVLWQVPIFGQPVGQQPLDEILAAWYPTHKAFLSMTSQAGSERSFRLRKLCIKTAVIHRCAEDVIPKP